MLIMSLWALWKYAGPITATYNFIQGYKLDARMECFNANSNFNRNDNKDQYGDCNFHNMVEWLLSFDGAASHLDLTDAHQMYLLCLPSNTTHELQQ